MNRLHRALRQVQEDLDQLGARWCLVGGLAVSAWAEPRLTRDIDIAVSVADDREAELLVRDLRARGYRVDALVEQEATGRIATARLALEAERNGVVIDLLFASSGIEMEAAAEAVVLALSSDLTLPVAPRPHLIVMKLLARDDRSRPLDADDLRALVGSASDRELTRARALARLVTERGFHRDRDLEALLETAVRDTP